MKSLSFFEKIYHFLSGSKNFFYNKNILIPINLNVPTVSVGNLSFGGVGKTPCIMLIANELELNFKIVIVTKSYKTDLKTPSRVDLEQKNASLKFGDEACLLKMKLPNCLIWAGPNKSETAIASLVDQPQLVLIDDGFSHRKLHRNFDLVLIDATQGFDTYLRESRTNLKRAQAVIITKVNIANPIAVEQIISEIIKNVPSLKNNIFVSTVKTFLNVNKEDPIYVFCGLGRPESFILDLKKQGFSVIAQDFFSDHHYYTDKDQKRIFAKYLDLKNQHRNLKLVTTEKDFVKIENNDLLKICQVTEHSMKMESELKEVLIAKIRNSF